VTTSKARVARIRLTFEASDPTHLKHVIAQLRKVDGVYDAYRIRQ